MALSELKQLEDELEAKERQWRSQSDESMAEIERLREEVQLQKKIVAGDLRKSREVPEADDTARMHDSFRMQELELENSQLKKDLGSLRKSVVEADSTTATKTLMEQFEAMQGELERRREECIQLHTVLAHHTRRMKATLGSSYGPDVDFVNEDGELVLAFEAQKKINRQLEGELQAKERQWKSQSDEWMAEIERLREKVQLQKKILTTNSSKSPQKQTEANMQQNEMTRLTFENWKLREKYEKAAEDCRKANQQIEILQSRLREKASPETAGVKIDGVSTMTHSSFNEATSMPQAICKEEPDTEDMSKYRKEDINVIMNNLIDATSMPEAICKKEPDFEDMSKFRKEGITMNNLINVPEKADVKIDVFSTTAHSSSSKGTLMPEDVCKKERDFEGMFEFRKEDIHDIMRNLITELKPLVAITLLPGLPAYILFMCVRHTDYINDDDKVRAFLSCFLDTIKRVIRNRDDFESAVLWLSNTLRLLHNMKQYAGDKPFQLENTPRQNEQCLRNFDLSEYRVVLSNVSLWIFKNIINQLRERMQPFVVPALLEHETIARLNSRPGRPRSGSIGPESTERRSSTDMSQERLNLLLEHLMIVHKTLQYHGVDPEIIVQIFKQLFYFMCASALNNLLLRNELCNWKKGMQIRFNLSHLEQWAKDVQMVSVIDSLQPIAQAAQLLQARKNDEDVDSVCEMCNKLTGNQIIKILNLYTPADEFETRVPVSFIRKVQEKLKERGDKNEELLMDLKREIPVRFPFNPSNIRLEDIDIPEVFNLPMLKKI